MARTKGSPTQIIEICANGSTAPSKVRLPVDSVTAGPTATQQQPDGQQSSDQVLIRKVPFQRLVRGIAAERKPDVRFRQEALTMLQEVTEDYAVDLFNLARRIANQCKRVTVLPGDIELAKEIREELLEKCNVALTVERLI